MNKLLIPIQLKQIIEADIEMNDAVSHAVTAVNNILDYNQLFFFEEFTDHGIRHVNSVLDFSVQLIKEETFEVLKKSPRSVGIFVLAVLLHDLGMQISCEGLLYLIENRDSVTIPDFDNKSWKTLWKEFLDKAYRYTRKEKLNIIGDANWEFKVPDLSDREGLDGKAKKLIGEFVRIYHPRLAHEIALNGFPIKDGVIKIADKLSVPLANLSGLIARSHGMEIRDTFPYLERKFFDTWTKPYNTEVIFLMVLLRIADYCQIDSSRINLRMFKSRSYYSPISWIEHLKHEEMPYVQQFHKDPETLVFHCTPRNSFTYVKLRELLSGLQNELDRSWAIIGEIYGRYDKHEQPGIKYRRIKSNIDDTGKFSEDSDFFPESVNFTISSELSGLLIMPLYGDDPTYGIRELLQNAVDSCRQRSYVENATYAGEINISFYKKAAQCYLEIKDNGTGMSFDVLKNYYLCIGSSFRDSSEYRRLFMDEGLSSVIQRTGRFGIGVLAAFLLGKTITLKSKSLNTPFGIQLQTGLDDDHIEITKINDLETGTTITIPINDATIKKLKDSRVRFDKWFAQDDPKILYKDKTGSFGSMGYSKLAPSCNKTLPDGWFELPQDKFDRVLWSFNGPTIFDDEGGGSRQKNLNAYLNGIFIPNIPAFLNVNRFCVTVDDFNKRFPINLNRNGMPEDFPFTHEIVQDIHYEFIARLLTMDVRSPFTNDGLLQIIHKDINHLLRGNFRLLFGNKGFIIAENYFLMKNSNKPYLILSVKDSLKYINELDCKGGFLEFSNKGIEYWRDIEQYKIMITPEVLSRVNFRSNFTDKMRQAQLQNEEALDKASTSPFLVMESSRFRSHFKLGNWAQYYPVLNYVIESTPEFCELAKGPSYYGEIGISHGSVEAFKSYLGDYGYIPYDLELRKEFFPKAFKELKRFMR